MNINDLTNTELSIVRCISKHSFKNARQISNLLEQDYSYVNKNINSLIKKGLLSRTETRPFEFVCEVDLENE
jgi:DNA-binding MarR family transcriptional regulator